MRRGGLLAAAAGVALAAGPAGAETLRAALARAYASNPTLAGERATLRANDENVPIQRAAGLPGIATRTGFNQNIVDNAGGVGPDRNATAGIDFTVPLYQGGAVENAVRAAETRVAAGREALRGAEANLFVQVVAVYNDVIRDEAIVRLNQLNVRVLQTNLQAARDRFEVGDLTITDVAQSEARLALAEGQLRQTEAQLVASRENYVRITGAAPGDLTPPPPLPTLPADAQAASRIALVENPNLLAAQRQRDATRFDIDVARSQRLPRVSATIGTAYQTFLGSVGNAAAGAGFRNSSIGLTGGLGLTLPLFQGGRPAAVIRQAQERQAAAVEGVTDAQRGVVAQTRSAFASYTSSLQVIRSSEVAVEANKLSLEGVRAENSVGNRTVLDILNAEAELLNSQVTLVTARRNAYVAGFALVAAMGRAEADDLGLDGGPLYDPTVHFERDRARISDWGGDEAIAPVGTPTADTAPQTPVVNGDPFAGDPMLQRPPETRPGAVRSRRPVDSAPADPAGGGTNRR